MTLELRPHHLLDIVTHYGHGVTFRPHPYGHALHLVAEQLLEDPDQEVVFVITADAICQPCRHLQDDGSCDDVLHQLAEPISKQSYNDDLDRRLWPILELDKGHRLTVRQFLARVQQHLPGIETICTHPGEEQAHRREGLQHGIARLETKAR
ncbi:MAG: DUF1284 domain-containing protein [Anaerolineae bacterium]|nr:DUF1284 domain-containing protein [Anaerolineae bacterium]